MYIAVAVTSVWEMCVHVGGYRSSLLEGYISAALFEALQQRSITAISPPLCDLHSLYFLHFYRNVTITILWCFLITTFAPHVYDIDPMDIPARFGRCTLGKALQDMGC